MGNGVEDVGIGEGIECSGSRSRDYQSPRYSTSRGITTQYFMMIMKMLRCGMVCCVQFSALQRSLSSLLPNAIKRMTH
jgi:hypothetical protein